MFDVLLVHEQKMTEMAPNSAGSCFYPTNLELAIILGDADFDFESFYACDIFGSLIS